MVRKGTPGPQFSPTRREFEHAADAFRAAALAADPRLSWFNPLRRIVYLDDFENGPAGFVEQIGNYRHDLQTSGDVYSGLQMQLLPPMISSLTSGHALVLRTRPVSGHLSKCTKRVTIGGKGLLQMECRFTFGVLGEEHQDEHDPPPIRCFGFNFDLQDDQERWWPSVRYVLAMEGIEHERWQWHAGGVRHPYLDGWLDIDQAEQPLPAASNESGGVWHYLRWSVDLATREYVEVQCDDRAFDLRGKRWMNRNIHGDELTITPYMAGVQPTIPSLWGLLNIGPFVQTDADCSVFIAIDSFVLSAEW